MKEKIHYLYKITNIDNGKVYIGVTSDIKDRKYRHLSGKGNKEIAKDLPGEFTWKILEEGEEHYIYNREVLVIAELNTLIPNGYNVHIGGSRPPISIGEEHNSAKLTEKDVLDIRTLYDTEKVSTNYLAKKFSMSPHAIWSIIVGKSWSHVGGPIQSIGLANRNNSGVNNTEALFSAVEVIEIRELYAEGNITQNHISKIYKVSRAAITNLLNGKTYKDVSGPIKKSRNRTIVTKELIVKMKGLRDKGLTYKNIGEIINCSPKTVSKYIQLSQK